MINCIKNVSYDIKDNNNKTAYTIVIDSEGGIEVETGTGLSIESFITAMDLIIKELKDEYELDKMV